jgi:hypothetical protein
MNEIVITRSPQRILIWEDDCFERLYRIINANALLTPSTKFGLESELRQIKCIIEGGEKMDYHKRCLLTCHLRNLQRLSPFTAQILITALAALPVMRELVRVEPSLYLPSTGDLLLL